MEENCKRKLQSGFRKTGVVLLNPDEVLATLPDEVGNAEVVQSTIGDVLVDHLKSYGDAQKIAKKKRLKVEAGKSIGDAEPPAIIAPPTEPQPSTSNADLHRTQAPLFSNKGRNESDLVVMKAILI